jgi:prepilin-type N-terminal cleavage/methylation domain-containing protein
MKAHTQQLRTRRSTHPRGVTLVELMVTVTVLGIIGAATLPVIMGVSQSYAESTRSRAAIERNAFAIDRITRWVREIPEGTTPGTVAIAAADASSIRLSDGRQIDLASGQLIEIDPTGGSSVLLENVTDFTLTLRGEDGATSTMGTPTQTQRIGFTLTSDGATLSAIAFIRARMTPP